MLRKILKFLLCALVIHAFIYGFYLLTSAGLPDKAIYLQLRRYIPCAVVVTAAIFLWQKRKYPLAKLWPYTLVGLAWIIIYNLTYYLTFNSNTTFIDMHYDIAFGTYSFAFTVCLTLMLHMFCSPKVTAIIIGSLHFLLLLIPITQIIYYFAYQSSVTDAGCMALVQTTPGEAKEFLLLNFGYLGLVGLGLFLVLLWFILYRGNLISLTSSYNIKQKTLIFTVIISITTLVYGLKILPDTGTLNSLHNARSYLQLSAKFTQNHAENYNLLNVTGPHQLTAKPSTVIMVIGESASKYYCSAYQSMDRDTTPWMRTMSQASTGFLFRHAYTSWGATVFSLERALTEKNQYNTADFNQSITIIDIAKKLGYTTYWFSNQGLTGGADTPITIVARTADHARWLEEEKNSDSGKKYDKDLLPYLHQVNPQENNFIILHVMGSHDNYINRYPPEFTRWGTPNKYEPILDYDNSIAYTDDFLKDVFNYGQKHLNLQALLYFSDHGADPLHKRNPDRSSFISLSIPMFLYLSPEYMSAYPETAQVLRSHVDSYFTNDLMYETVCGLLQVKYEHYELENSLTSSLYKWNKNNLTTNLGKTPLTQDTAH